MTLSAERLAAITSGAKDGGRMPAPIVLELIDELRQWRDLGQHLLDTMAKPAWPKEVNKLRELLPEENEQ